MCPSIFEANTQIHENKEPTSMLRPVHARITRRALGDKFSPRALAVILNSNVRLDALHNQFGHDEFHFDNNAFEASRAYIEAQRALILPALGCGDAHAAWEAFGRLTHTAQDFYAHSNYVDLWLACQPNGMVPAATEIDPLDDSLVENPSLRSGKMYFPLGFLSFVPGLKRWVVPRMPRDSHAWMNLDSEARGPMFEYAFHAAVKRTRFELEILAKALTNELYRAFTEIL
jgi:hypothetical protein